MTANPSHHSAGTLKGELSRELTLFHITMMGLGMMIGAGVFLRIGNAIFVAHDVKFDYRFISLSMQKIDLAPLLNRSLCSLALAERTIVSYRYALSYLNESLHLHPDATHHRAMSDVLTTYELFKISLENLKDIDKNVKTAEDLIKFSKEAKRFKRPKFDPLLESQEEEKEDND